MQIYVPTPDAVTTAEILANAELLEVIAACTTILEEMHKDGEPSIIAALPLYKMWEGHGFAVASYGLSMCEEITHRGFMPGDPKLAESEKNLHEQLENATAGEYVIGYPAWWGDANLHHAHQSELLRRNPRHYYRYFAGIPMDLPQVWPV